MTISEKIFELLEQRNITQREFSEKTGIAQGAISDWKRKKTNPSADKILIICQVLDVSPDELLSGTMGTSQKSKSQDYYIIDKDSSIGFLVESFQRLDNEQKERILGYIEGGLCYADK